MVFDVQTAISFEVFSFSTESTDSCHGLTFTRSIVPSSEPKSVRGLLRAEVSKGE